MKIALVNDVHVGAPLEYQGKIRASSPLMEEILPSYLHEIMQRHKPDLLINLGDLIRSKNNEEDCRKYDRLIKIFNTLPIPVIHLLGNHELKALSSNKIEEIWHQNGFNQQSYGIREFGPFTLIWLGLELDANDYFRPKLPFEQCEWLKIQLKEAKYPSLIFTHCAIDDHNLDGNFFYEGIDKHKKEPFFLKNQALIREAIGQAHCVKAVFQAHLHYFHVKRIDNIPYITCPAMGDNIYAPNVKDVIPKIYTILHFDERGNSAKVYSDEYCFAGYEW